MQRNNIFSKTSISNTIALWAFIVSIVSCIYSYNTAQYTKESNIIAYQQTIIADQQKEIAQQQTDILDRQTDIQNEALQFEKDKNRTDTTKASREKMDILVDKIYQDVIFAPIYQKMINSNSVQNLNNLDMFVDTFEEIWILYCNWEIKISDMRSRLKNIIRPICGSSQIYNRYQNSKSGLSAICEVLHPWSSVMAKYVNPQKCLILEE